MEVAGVGVDGPGRDFLRGIRRDLETAPAGPGPAGPRAVRTVLVEGPPASGKSHLLREAVEIARRAGAAVLSSTAAPAGQDGPLGVVGQLLSGLPGHAPGDPGVADALRSPHEFCALLRRASLDHPVLCCVDDIHHADDASLCFLHALAHAQGHLPVLLTVTRSPHFARHRWAGTAGPFPGAHLEQVRLGPLTHRQLADLVGARPHLAGEPRTPDLLHALTGGNRWLLAALLEEAGEEPVASLQPRPHGPFAQAVLGCIPPSAPAARELAEALAVLGEPGPTERVAQLLQRPVAAVVSAVEGLNAAGVLRGHRFRHPAARQAVLDGTEPGTRERLHRRYAVLLHQAGAPARDVAPHLLASAFDGGRALADLPWTVDVLRERADQLIAQDDARGAAQLLEAARAACADPGLAAEIGIRLAAVAWRFDPAAAERHLASPLLLARSGELTPGRTGVLARVLGAQGRITDARDIGSRSVLALGGSAAGPVPPHHNHTVLWSVPDDTLEQAEERERFLAGTALTEHTLLPVLATLRALVLFDRTEAAIRWCRRQVEVAQERDAPAWVSAFTSVHGEALLQLGDLRGARAQALCARESLPAQGHAVLAVPAQILLARVSTAMGRHAAAGRVLDTLAPDLLCDTVFYPAYLHARGRYLLALGQASSALHDFHEAGQTLVAWGMDRPLDIAWRSDAAEALLGLGDVTEARRLLRQQLAMPDARQPRIHGMTLRGQAAAADPAERRDLLERAVRELCRSRDRLQLARALTDLGDVLHRQGDRERAATVHRRAARLARSCGVVSAVIAPGDPLPERPRPPAPREAEAPAPQRRSVAALSSSEQRVAALAARGYTNREISARLYITQSTVEQHLTRVYRKLRIQRRRDLPAQLELDSPFADGRRATG